MAPQYIPGVAWPVAWLSPTRDVVRWVISDRSQRMHKYSAIPKDAHLCEDLIFPFASLIEVLDKTENTMYSISVADFKLHKWLLKTKAGEQWAVDRKHWATTDIGSTGDTDVTN